MSPLIIPERVIPPAQFAPETKPEVETILPRTTFNPPANRADSVNAQVEANHSLATLANRYLPGAVGALKGDHKAIIAKLDQLLAGLDEVKARLDRLESAQ